MGKEKNAMFGMLFVKYPIIVHFENIWELQRRYTLRSYKEIEVAIA